MSKLIAFLIPSILLAHEAPEWIDLPIPVPVSIVDGSLEDLPKISPIWNRYSDIAPSEDSGWGLLWISFQSQESILSSLPDEQIDLGCLNYPYSDRYGLNALLTLGSIDSNDPDCASCFSDPNSNECLYSTCIQWGDGVDGINLESLAYGPQVEEGIPVPFLYKTSDGLSLDNFPNLLVTFLYYVVDRHYWCNHDHPPGSYLHAIQYDSSVNSLPSPWILMSDLRSGSYQAPPPVLSPEDRLQAKIDSLQSLIDAQNCPLPAPELNSLFEAFNDSTAGKALSSPFRSWGQIKATFKGD